MAASADNKTPCMAELIASGFVRRQQGLHRILALTMRDAGEAERDVAVHGNVTASITP
jgi:hypothetical protein